MLFRSTRQPPIQEAFLLEQSLVHVLETGGTANGFWQAVMQVLYLLLQLSMHSFCCALALPTRMVAATKMVVMNSELDHFMLEGSSARTLVSQR